MANTMYLHPSITSTIVDNSGFYASADGQTTLFAPGFFEKGRDNELITVNGPTDAELVNKFGKIDPVEYGQNHLNLVNWLTAGGSAVVMRCLPENAKYAHAILEVLTKDVTVKGSTITVGDKVYNIVRDFDTEGDFQGLVYFNDENEKIVVCSAENADKLTGDEPLADGETIKDIMECDGTVKSDQDVTVTNVIPKITYVPSGVSKKATIEAYISHKNGQKNADGYTRHILGYFFPEGRGAKFYNDVRININLAPNYDGTYDFRVYSVTFEKHDLVNDEWGILSDGGPFYVSFDETARDNSNESMFIGDVLERYCSEFRFVPFGSEADEDSGNYNKGFYDAAKAIAGDNVNLRRVDVLSCQEYYSEETDSYSNIHRNCIVAGGTLSLRKDAVLSPISKAAFLYSEDRLPVVGSELIIANSMSNKVSAINITSYRITVEQPFSTCAYTPSEIASIESEEEAEYAASVAVRKETDGIVYINDINEPTPTATIKRKDDAIERINSKKFRIYLNNNGADWIIGSEVTIHFPSISLYSQGDDPKTVEQVSVNTSELEDVPVGSIFKRLVSADAPTYVLVPDEDTKMEDIDLNEDGTIFFKYYAEQTPACWKLEKVSNDGLGGEVYTTDLNVATYSTENPDVNSPADDGLSWNGLDLTFDGNIESQYLSMSYSDVNFNAKISEIDDVNDAVIVDFNGVANDERDAHLIAQLQNLDWGDPNSNNFDGGTGGDETELVTIIGVESAKTPYAKCLSLQQGDYAYMQYGSAGDADVADGASRATVAKTRRNLLIKAFRGTLNEGILLKKYYPIDVLLDANYDDTIKNAMNELTLTREDCMFICDTGFAATPDEAILKRNNGVNFNNRYTAIFTQNLRVYDEYSAKNMKVTPTYFLAKKIPYVDRAFGCHYAFVGPNRGEVEGFVEGSLAWNPTEPQKEKLYKKQINYIQQDPNHTMFMGQLTSQKKSTSLSDIPNVRALLRIRRDMEAIMEEYYFERINDNLLTTMTNAGNKYLEEWLNNGCCTTARCQCYASDYDRKCKLVRVSVELVFTSFVERVLITFSIQ